MSLHPTPPHPRLRDVCEVCKVCKPFFRYYTQAPGGVVGNYFPLNFTFHSGTPRETMHLLLLGVGFVSWCISPVCLASFLWRRFFCGRISHETCDTPHGFCVSVPSNDIRHVLGHDSSAALMGILSGDWSMIYDEHMGSTVNFSWNDFPEMVK